MAASDLPAAAAWRHHTARDGFETVFFSERPDGWVLQGHTTAVEDGVAWAIRYDIITDLAWRTRTAHIWSQSASGLHELVLESDGAGHWHVDGARTPQLDDCFDVDLESSACTNALPVHRCELPVGVRVDAPALWVRAPTLEVQRLEQTYERVEGDGDRQRFDYRSPAFGFEALLTFDAAGLVMEYPGLASRVL